MVYVYGLYTVCVVWYSVYGVISMRLGDDVIFCYILCVYRLVCICKINLLLVLYLIALLLERSICVNITVYKYKNHMGQHFPRGH